MLFEYALDICHHRARDTLIELEDNVARKAVRNEHVAAAVGHVASLDVADEVDFFRILEKIERLMAQAVALAVLGADIGKRHARRLNLDEFLRVYRAHLSELL